MGWNNSVFPLLIVTSGSGFTGLFEYSPGPGTGNLIASSTAQAGTDPFGNAYLAGIATYSPAAGIAQQLNTNGVFYYTGPAGGGGPWTQVLSEFYTTGTLQITGTSAGLQNLLIANPGGAVQYVFPSGDPSGATDAANINAVLHSPQLTMLLLVAGTYYINAALTPNTNQSIIGAGAGATVINQVTHAAEGITCNGKSTITLRGFTLVGAGSGVSTAAGIHFASNPPTANIILDDVIVQNFGLQGFLLDSLFLVNLRKCEALQNGGNGFQVTNSFAVPTSFTFESCYANGNLGNYGYELDALQYSSLAGCAADGNASGYGLLGCQGVTLTGCGTEAFTATGYLFNNCKGCNLLGGFTFNGKTKVAWMTNGSNRCAIGGLTETSPAAGATACVQTDAGTSFITLWGITHVTADSLTAGTFTNVDGSA
jgi:hypothetical protein